MMQVVAPNAAAQPHLWQQGFNNNGDAVLNVMRQFGTDPTSKQAAAIADLAAAIRELADVLYHIGTED